MSSNLKVKMSTISKSKMHQNKQLQNDKNSKKINSPDILKFCKCNIKMVFIGLNQALYIVESWLKFISVENVWFFQYRLCVVIVLKQFETKKCNV